MLSPPPPKPKRFLGRTEIIVIGLVLAIIGSIIASSFPKDSTTNYTGFGMLLSGIAITILGACAAATASIKNRLCTYAPNSRLRRIRILSASVWFVGLGLVLAVLGSILASVFDRNNLLNSAGFNMLISGIFVFFAGVVGTMLSMMGTYGAVTGKTSGLKVEKTRGLLGSIAAVCIGMALIIVGWIIAGCYSKETLENYAGFGALLAGIMVLSIGVCGAVVGTIKKRLTQAFSGQRPPAIILGGIWAVGIGAMLVIVGSLIASSYAKSTMMNYAGFGLLLAGAGVFVYGIFETARISALGYLSSKKMPKLNPQDTVKRKQKLSTRINNSLIGSRAILNVAGLMSAIGLLFFSLWQLDLIVSGPVWYPGWAWSGPEGAYADHYFQCYLWKTTIGQAYDTLFMLVFISFVILFVSAFFWPRWQKEEPRKEEPSAATPSSSPFPPPPPAANEG